MLSVENLSKTFADKEIFSGVNFEAREGEILAILGPSGCGKTTMLRMISGLESTEQGSIQAFGKAIEQARTDIGFIFQKPVLFPHLNVEKNLLLGAKNKIAKAERPEVVSSALKQVGLDGFQSRKIDALSGGERQRLALARALLGEPKLLLLDEPFSALDINSRRSITEMCRDLLKSRGVTAVHITHDPAEAELISDRVLNWHQLVQEEE